MSVSITAAFIAAKFYGLLQIPRYRVLFEHEIVTYYEQQFSLLSGVPNRLKQMIQSPAGRRFLVKLEEKILPGDLLHILQRKWMMHQLLTSLPAGFDQLVVLGSGFDHLATYGARHGMHTIEIDIPDTIKAKNSILTSLGMRRDNHHLIKYSFKAESIPSFFEASAVIKSAKKTLIVTEGFWDYLTPKASALLVQQIARYWQEELRIVSTVFDLKKLAPAFRLVYTGSIRLAGEQLIQVTSKESMEHLFVSNGFENKAFYTSEDLISLMFQNGPLLSQLPGFSIAQFDKLN